MEKPKCACGEEMKKVSWVNYYDELEYWECFNPDCTVIEDADIEVWEAGSYASNEPPKKEG